MTSSDSELQQFALGVYAADGVSAAALLLQDKTDVDVNVLLFAAHLGAAGGRTLRADDVAAARQRIGEWHADVVRPLRALRTRLKAGPPPAPNDTTAQLRERVKKLEIDAELIELDELALVAAQLDAPAADGSAAQRAAAAMRVVVVDSAGRPPTADENDAISVIAAAAAQYGEEGR